MEKYRCKICLRKFGNGRALGGHMRSHMMNLDAPVHSKKQQQSSEKFVLFLTSSSSSSSSSSEEENENEIEIEKNEVDPVFSGAVVGAIVDRESETEWSKKRKNFRGSNKIRKSIKCDKFGKKGNESSSSLFGFVEVKPVSSISDTTPEEDVAYCLIMLSRDTWIKEKGDNEKDVGKVSKFKSRDKYRCETCNKIFRSYQALGGHRASHKKIKQNKIHQCPVCYRVFTSGQALGGHKRSHGTSKQPFERIIDLNLPAPLDDDDDDDEISQMAFSVVSD